METIYRQTLVVRWGDLDANGHMANTAYLDVCVDVRLGFFESQGFSRDEFSKRRFGPIVRRDEVDYYRELRLGQTYHVDLRLSGMSDDATRFRLCNRFFGDDGALLTRVLSLGGWFSLDQRRLIEPPAELRSVLENVARTEDFEQLPSSIRR